MAAFDWRSPKLRESCLDELGMARHLQHLTVNDAFLRVLHKGKPSAAVAESMALALQKSLENVAAKLPAVLQLASQELVLVCKAVLLLCGHMEIPVKMLDDIPASCDVVKELVGQVPYWRESERRVRQVAVALGMFRPEITKTITDLEGPTVTSDQLVLVSKRLAVWQEALPRGVLGRVSQS